MPSTPVCMIGMMIVSEYLFKKISENPLPSGFLSRHGVKEKHQPLYQKLVLTMAQKEGFVSPHSSVRSALRPHCGLIHLLAVQIPPRFLVFFAKTKETLISQSLFLGAEGGICLSSLVGPLGSKAALRPYSPPRGSNSSALPSFLCKNKRDSDFSKSLSWRRRRDLNPRAAYRSLLP